MNSRLKTFAVWMLMILVVVLVIQAYQNHKDSTLELSYSEFWEELTSQDNVVEVTIKGQEVSGKLRKGIKLQFRTYAPEDDQLLAELRARDVAIKVIDASEKLWFTALISWLPLLLLFGVWIFFLRQVQGGGKSALAFGKSRARLTTDQQKKVTFADVAGIEEAKEELAEIIAFLQDPGKFMKLGGRIPKGVLLMGPPGTGKTLLARAIAGEAGVPFFSISGSDFVEMFVGVGASRVRDLFDQGKKQAPCLIFIDEIDAVGRHRGAGLGGGHDEREQTLNQLLVEMDGFESNEGVILLAATNRPDILDPALLRPGRFDRRVVVDRPDISGRLGILKVHARKVQLAPDVDFEIIARGTPGFVGADLANLVNEAALLASRKGKEHVQMEDFDEAKDKVLMGTERRSLILSDTEKKSISIHESGHALVAMLLPNTDPIHKVTIVPRGKALGLTQQLPIDEKHIYPEEYIRSEITIMMGGRAAELIEFDSLSTGASNDLARATDLARKMVCEWGMSSLGPLTFGKRDDQIFLGRDFAQRASYSEESAQRIDQEIQRVVTESFDHAYSLLRENLDILHAFSSELLKREVLTMKDMETLLSEYRGSNVIGRSLPDSSSEGLNLDGSPDHLKL